MSELMTESYDGVDRLSGEPASVQLYEMFKRRIIDHDNTPEQDRLFIGDQMPSIAQLHERYGIARGTAGRVLALLQDDDLIEVTPSVGAKVIWRP